MGFLKDLSVHLWFYVCLDFHSSFYADRDLSGKWLFLLFLDVTFLFFFCFFFSKTYKCPLSQEWDFKPQLDKRLNLLLQCCYILPQLGSGIKLQSHLQPPCISFKGTSKTSHFPPAAPSLIFLLRLLIFCQLKVSRKQFVWLDLRFYLN